MCSKGLYHSADHLTFLARLLQTAERLSSTPTGWLLAACPAATRTPCWQITPTPSASSVRSLRATAIMLPSAKESSRACRMPAALLAMAWVSWLHFVVAAWDMCLPLSAAVRLELPARHSSSPAGLGIGEQASALSVRGYMLMHTAQRASCRASRAACLQPILGRYPGWSACSCTSWHLACARVAAVHSKECRLGQWSRHFSVQGWRELSRDALITGTHTVD